LNNGKDKESRIRGENVPVMEYQPLYTVPAVAKIMRVTNNFVYEKINSGELPALRLGSLKIRGSDLEKYIEGQEPVSRGEGQ